MALTDDRARAWQALRLAPDDAARLVARRRDPWSRWVAGVLALAQGDIAGSVRILEPLSAAGEREVAGLACARIGSALRQIDEHAAAVPWDDRAAAAGGRATVDGLIGLAADEVGQGNAVAAAELLARAAVRADDWRDRVRLAWVGTEIALLSEDHALAQEHAEAALSGSLAVGSPRHVVKSRLFLGAAVRQRDPDAAAAVLRPALTMGLDLRLRPFVWPIVGLLEPDVTAEQRRAAGDAVRFVAARLPLGYGARWRQRADIRRLLAD